VILHPSGKSSKIALKKWATRKNKDGVELLKRLNELSDPFKRVRGA